jgi:hypothetical protein
MDLNTIYLVCAVAGGTVLVLRILLMLIGIQFGGDIDTPDMDADFDASGAEHSAGGEVNFLSIQSLSSFFTLFGLVGMGLLQVGASQILSLLGGLVAGVLTAWISGMIVVGLTRLQSSGTMDISNAIGQQGRVYLTIPEGGSGVVSVAVQGALRQFDAVSENGMKIPTGALVRVTGLSAGNTLVVVQEPLENTSQSSGG